MAPSDISINNETNDATNNVIGHGEINRVGDHKLKKMNINSVFPMDSDEVPYTTAPDGDMWRKATSYITFLNNIVESKKPCRLVIAGSNISLKANLQFTYGMSNGNAQEYSYNLIFTEYRPVMARKLGSSKKKKVAKKGKPRSKPSHKINRGSTVLINGQAYLNKDAAKGVSIRKRQCNIKIVSKNAKHPFYVVATDGTPIGWVSKEAIK